MDTAVGRVLAAVVGVTAIQVDVVKVDPVVDRVVDRAKEQGGKANSPIVEKQEHGEANQG